MLSAQVEGLTREGLRELVDPAAEDGTGRFRAGGGGRREAMALLSSVTRDSTGCTRVRLSSLLSRS